MQSMYARDYVPDPIYFIRPTPIVLDQSPGTAKDPFYNRHEFKDGYKVFEFNNRSPYYVLIRWDWNEAQLEASPARIIKPFCDQTISLPRPVTRLCYKATSIFPIAANPGGSTPTFWFQASNLATVSSPAFNTVAINEQPKAVIDGTVTTQIEGDVIATLADGTQVTLPDNTVVNLPDGTVVEANLAPGQSVDIGNTVDTNIVGGTVTANTDINKVINDDFDEERTVVQGQYASDTLPRIRIMNTGRTLLGNGVVALKELFRFGASGFPVISEEVITADPTGELNVTNRRYVDNLVSAKANLSRLITAEGDIDVLEGQMTTRATEAFVASLKNSANLPERNSWTATSGNGPRAVMGQNGFVSLTGALDRATNMSGAGLVCALPAAFRPPSLMTFVVVANGSWAIMQVDPSGDVSLTATRGVANVNKVWLDNIAYRVAP